MAMYIVFTVHISLSCVDSMEPLEGCGLSSHTHCQGNGHVTLSPDHMHCSEYLEREDNMVNDEVSTIQVEGMHNSIPHQVGLAYT